MNGGLSSLNRCLLTIVFAENDEIVGLRTVIAQVKVLAEEAKQFWTWSVIREFVSRQAFILYHELKDAKTDTLSLKRLMDIEVKDAARIDLRLRTSAHEQTLVASFE